MVVAGNCRAMLPENSPQHLSIFQRLFFVLLFKSKLASSSWHRGECRLSSSHPVHSKLAFCLWHNLAAKEEYVKSVFTDNVYRCFLKLWYKSNWVVWVRACGVREPQAKHRIQLPVLKVSGEHGWIVGFLWGCYLVDWQSLEGHALGAQCSHE